MTSQIQIKDKHFNLFLSEKEILDAIRQTAIKMEQDLKELQPLFICVLNGAFMFASDLLKLFDFPCEITFIRLKSYEGTQTDGRVKEVQGLIEKIENRHVVILEDIIDTGHTVARLKAYILSQQPASFRVASLLFKPGALLNDIQPDYAAIHIPNDFIVGYGLDYDGLGRNLRNIYKIKN
ncbi:MAG: hypoxanthine phosphoribosyltransferase [Dysgonamonadaceae bacterium]|jgi:hypoxanthine phosphoribosyltransferase|nr:hypoxanthine phosphoribosyltransferase [Dysgonamonadaceae bacterium]